MKVPPLNLNPDMNRVGMSIPFSPDMLWRYPMSFPQSGAALPSSPLLDVKNQMPTHLAPDPRMWTREDVSSFLRWFEREFELPSIDLAKFCMNGKALCMLTKSDLADRAPAAGDILHNTLQFLLRDAPQIPPSPLTPHHPLLSPSPLTPTSAQPWSLIPSDIHSLGQLLHQGGSVTLSPAPSEQSGGSPRHPDHGAVHGSHYTHSSSASTGSAQSGSDSEDSTRDSTSPQRSPIPTHHTVTPSISVQALASLKQLTDYQRAVAAAAAAHSTFSSCLEESQKPHHSLQPIQPAPQSQPSQPTPPPLPPVPSDEPESSPNVRLLWDFLQQLLNDSQQRYCRYIAWKNRDTGVFKIVDPAGLARLWGIQKNHLSMNYDKMSRALRYYYRVNILRKVQGERHCYQFLRNPTELKNIKNISLLRAAAPPSPRTKEAPVVGTPMEEDEGPTDLSMTGIQTHYQSHRESPYQQTHLSVETQPQNLVVDRPQQMSIKQEDYTDTFDG